MAATSGGSSSHPSIHQLSTIENKEYFHVATTEISNNVGNDSIASLSVGKLASTTSCTCDRIGSNFAKGRRAC